MKLLKLSAAFTMSSLSMSVFSSFVFLLLARLSALSMHQRLCFFFFFFSLSVNSSGFSYMV